jgi:hypothetical protein
MNFPEVMYKLPDLRVGLLLFYYSGVVRYLGNEGFLHWRVEKDIGTSAPAQRVVVVHAVRMLLTLWYLILDTSKHSVGEISILFLLL